MSDTLKLTCGWIGATLSLFFFISPIVPIIKLCKKQIKVKEIPIVMFVCSVLNCTLWFSYGLFIEEHPVWVCNAIGALFTSFWIIIYFVFYVELQWLKAIIYNLLYCNFIGELYYIVHIIVGKEHNDIIGWIVMVINILMYASPGANIYNFYKTGNLELLPIYSVITSLVSSTFWLIYGITLVDFSIMVPNGLGVAFSIFQLVSWIYVRNREIKKKKKLEAEQQDTEGVQLPVKVQLKTGAEQSNDISHHSNQNDPEKIEPVPINVGSG